MTPSFLMMIGAACILRFLAAEAKRAFAKRLAGLLPRNVMEEHLNALREFPQHYPVFRARVLPFSALQIACNAASCICFVAALWYFPPSALSETNLYFMRYGSMLVVPAAFLFDVFVFVRLFCTTLTASKDELED